METPTEQVQLEAALSSLIPEASTQWRDDHYLISWGEVDGSPEFEILSTYLNLEFEVGYMLETMDGGTERERVESLALSGF